jgi:hypothetical protein
MMYGNLLLMIFGLVPKMMSLLVAPAVALNPHPVLNHPALQNRPVLPLPLLNPHPVLVVRNLVVVHQNHLHLVHQNHLRPAHPHPNLALLVLHHLLSHPVHLLLNPALHLVQKVLHHLLSHLVPVHKLHYPVLHLQSHPVLLNLVLAQTTL